MANLAEIRQQYPQYNDMSDADLASALHKKFYSDIPRADFDKKIGLAERLKEKPKPDTPVSGAQDTLLSGMTMGWSDEVAGAGRYVGRALRNATDDLFGIKPRPGDLTPEGTRKSPYDAYVQGRDATRQNVQQFTEENPVTGVGLQLLGGLAAGRPVPGFAVAPTLAGRVGQGMQVGVPIGAIAGAGGADGDLADRALGAGQGAAFGAVLGAALPAVAQGVSAGIRHAGNMFGLRPAEVVANEKLAAAMVRDNTTPERLLAEIQRRQFLGEKPEALMDLGGEAMRRTARTAMARPGEASSRGVVALTERQAAQPERVAQDLSRLSGNNDFYGTMENLGNQRAAQAAPLYREAFDNPSPVWNERIQQFIDSPEAKQGLARGLTVQRREALARGEPFDPRSYGVTGFNEAGDPIIGGTPNLRLLDSIKRGLDDMLEAYRSPLTGRLQLNEEGRALEKVRQAFVNEVDRAAPQVYRDARAAWAGPSQSMNAIEAGRDFMTLAPEQIAKRIQQLPAAERDFYRAGALRALMEKISKTSNNADVVRNIFGTPQRRAQIEAIFPSRQAFLDFEQAMQREAAMLRNARFVSPNTGSQTFLRQIEAADAAPNPIMEAVAGMVQGESPKRALLGTLTGRAVSRAGGYTPTVANRLIDALVSPDADLQRQALGGLLNFTHRPADGGLLGGRIRQGLLTGVAGPYGGR